MWGTDWKQSHQQNADALCKAAWALGGLNLLVTKYLPALLAVVGLEKYF